jgi:hypothetical protein
MTVFSLPHSIDNFRQSNTGRVAFHEAGHAVIASVLNLKVASVTIKPEGCVAGFTELPWLGKGPLGGALYSDVEWLALKDAPIARAIAPSDRALRAHLITLLAGPAAEKFYCGGAVHLGARSDNAHVRTLMRYFTCDRARLKRMAEMLVRRHSFSTLQIALELARKKRLSGEHLERLLNTLTQAHISQGLT